MNAERRSSWWWMACALALVIATWTWAQTWAETGQRAASAAQEEVARIRVDARRVVGERERGVGITLDRQPADAVVAQIRAAMLATGITESTLTSIAPQDEQAVDRQRIRWRSVTVRWSGLTPGACGALLAELRRAAPAWQVTRLDFQARAAADVGADAAAAYDIACTIAAPYLATSPL